MNTTHRTQFDGELLAESKAAVVCRNHGRQVLALEDGSVFTALVWAGDAPVLRVWKGRELAAEHFLNGQPSAPCLVSDGKGGVTLWISVDDKVCSLSPLTKAPMPVEGRPGVIQDVAVGSNGRVFLAVQRGTGLYLASTDSKSSDVFCVDDQAGQASLEFDTAGRLHLAFEKKHGIEYRQFQTDAPALKTVRNERPAGAFGYAPVLLAHDGKIFLGYLGESCRPADRDAEFWKGKPWHRRNGLGGYVAVLVFDGDRWQRFALADSQQFVKPIWPKTERFGYDYPNVEVRAQLDEFSPPALTVGPDGVTQVFWANTARRWIFSSRFLGADFSPAVEVRGPLETLTGPCLLLKRVPPNRREMPLAMITKTRTYLDALRLPSREVHQGRRIDFLQPDELAECHGLELALNTMRRFADNPVMRSSGPGAHDEAGRVLMDIIREGDTWRAQCLSKATGRKWRRERLITSPDGIQWPQSPHIPDSETYLLDGEPKPLVFRGLSYVEDQKETNPQHRFKGFLAHGPPWGNMAPVTSPDGIQWFTVKDRVTPIMSDGCFVWIDEDDIPERRFKAIGNARSFCGRVCAQWTSPDGLHWNDQRDSLDFNDPFGSEPYWWEDYPHGSTGRILVDPWAGPNDEDEIHGGVVFRDGDRWLLHYMKWTADGHIIPALAASRDGINYSRVGGGVATLPLGEPGTWDSGRIALAEPPFQVGGVWRQYFTGCGWKHGLFGEGKAPHRTSNNVGLYSPNQVGIAEIEVGHWGHLWVSRAGNSGTLVTIPLGLKQPHVLSLDIDGLDQPGNSIACAILAAETKRPLAGYDFSFCDPIPGNGREMTVSWRGSGSEKIGPSTIRIAVRLTGHRVKLFGLNLGVVFNK
ncbi:MAG: hypothetical protein HY360_02335 [Verrucomicrobia bacterium]|nr:hypothetical protein [Verrucomicrobiota bacterium]